MRLLDANRFTRYTQIVERSLQLPLLISPIIGLEQRLTQIRRSNENAQRFFFNFSFIKKMRKI